MKYRGPTIKSLRLKALFPGAFCWLYRRCDFVLAGGERPDRARLCIASDTRFIIINDCIDFSQSLKFDV